jgi:hypothetical protein
MWRDDPTRTIAYDGNGDSQYIYRVFADTDYEYTEIGCFPAKKRRHITEAEETEYLTFSEEDGYDYF